MQDSTVIMHHGPGSGSHPQISGFRGFSPTQPTPSEEIAAFSE
jgi:hypothetical protein